MMRRSHGSKGALSLFWYSLAVTCCAIRLRSRPITLRGMGGDGAGVQITAGRWVAVMTTIVVLAALYGWFSLSRISR